MKKILLSVLCLFSIIAVHADEVTVTFSEQGYTNAQEVTELTINSHLQANFDKGSNSSTTPKYYNTGTAYRLYGGNTMTITGAEGVVINSITLTTRTGSYVVNSASTVSAGTLSINEGTATITGINANSIVFTQGGSSGHVRIISMTIDYTAAASGATLEAPTASLEPGVFYNTTSVELSASDGEIHYTLDGTEPTAESPVYSDAIAIDNFGATTVVKAIAIDGEEYSNVSTFSYNLQVAAPKFSSDGGVYEGLGYAYSTPILNIQTETTGAKIQYTWTNYAYNEEGDEETKNTYGTSVNLTIKGTTSVKATAFKVVGNDTVWSESVTKYYTISPIKPHQAATTIANGKYLIDAVHLHPLYSLLLQSLALFLTLPSTDKAVLVSQKLAPE